MQLTDGAKVRKLYKFYSAHLAIWPFADDDDGHSWANGHGTWQLTQYNEMYNTGDG